MTQKIQDIRLIKREEIDKRLNEERRAEIATLRGVCALLAVKYPEVLLDEYRKLTKNFPDKKINAW